jgi:hypothetical protein
MALNELQRCQEHSSREAGVDDVGSDRPWRADEGKASELHGLGDAEARSLD